ncbi:COX15/CtaA family protein [Aliamphritea spongicola]|uniref:COX15/CtaA family protein n=1 Tax=Aliamphritea spongicola TaxID=707589 RepID=UPI00196B1973|nr:COX15/CtaA family protein [Aliamphritea spongicola]MBN3564761.1 COX15/CtaA family protein [Aliamphritea spongicola]
MHLNSSDRQNYWPVRICLLAILMTLVVVSMGAWTRLNNAGLGCPDWPGCYGQVVVPMTPTEIALAEETYGGQVDVSKGMIEMVHRYLASSLGMVIMLLAWFAYRHRKQGDYPVYLSYGLLLLVITQGLFGMWTVTLKLLPVVVTLHLLGGLLTLSLLIRLYQRLKDSPAKEQQRKSHHWLVGGAVILLFTQLVLGGWTSANYAGWSCPHWLQCADDQTVLLDFKTGFDVSAPIGPNYEGGMLSLEARAAIQMTHRGVAVLLCAYLLIMAVILFRRPALRSPLVCVLLVVAAQIGLGIGNIIFGLPLGLAMAHHSGAVLLLVSLLWLYQRVRTEVHYGAV